MYGICKIVLDLLWDLVFGNKPKALRWGLGLGVRVRHIVKVAVKIGLVLGFGPP